MNMFRPFALLLISLALLPGGAFAQSREATTVEMYLDGGTYTVPVKISNGAQEHSVTLTFDTGSSYSALPLEVIKELNLTPAREVRARLADGTITSLTMYILPKMIVGACKISNTEVVGIPRERGILGMKDLEDFRRFTFDTGRLIIECNDSVDHTEGSTDN